MKLYHFKVDEGFGPELIKSETNSTEAGRFCYGYGKHEENVFLLLHEGRLYYYVDMSDGYGWEACSGEDGPSFCTD